MHCKDWLIKSYGWLRSRDLLLLLAGLGVVLGTWGFFILADAVREGETQSLDVKVLRAFRQPGHLETPLGPHWLQGAVRDVTALGSATVLGLVALAVAGFFIIRRQFHALGALLGAIGGGTLLSWGLKDWISRPRPQVVPHLVEISGASFPSGHSLLSAVVYLTLGAFLARLVEPLKLRIYVIIVAFTFTFLVGLSRMYLGVHYPTDVLAGWTVGLLWAVLCWVGARLLQRRGKLEGPPESKEERPENFTRS